MNRSRIALPARPSAKPLRVQKDIVSTIVLFMAGMGAAHAGNFDITTPSTSPQTLGPASGQSGTVEATGSLSVSGSTVAVTFSGNNATLTNLGTITQTGSGRDLRDNTGVSSLIVNNGSAANSSALMQTANADVFQMNVSPASVVLNNYGTMTSLNSSKGGAQAVDFNAIASGSNVINNFSTGILQAQDADAVRPGVNGVVYNAGTITVSVSSSSGNDGIDAQTNSGVQITNDTTGLISGARHGITGGNTTGAGAFTMSITNNLGGVIRGNDGSGVNIDGINGNELVTIVNHGTITGNGSTGDGDGVDVDGLVNLINTGTIRSLNAFNDTSEGVTAGGGVITNSGTIEGSISSAANNTGTGRGITIAGVDKDSSDNPIPIQAPYGATTITNSGLIKGDSDSAIAFTSAFASGFSHTITNQAGGVLQTGSTTVAAIVTAADNVTINNSGTIDGSSSGKAITGGSGNLTLNISGGSASVLGNIAGGVGGANTMTIDAGTGNSFSYSGSISNMNSVAIKSGSTTLSGVSTYTGTTQISGGALILNGSNRLAAGSALNLNGGTLQLANAGGANAQTFSSFSLSDTSLIDLAESSLTFNALGTINGSKSLTIIDWSASSSPDYAFRILGNDTTNASFLALASNTTIDGQHVAYQFDGTYTDVAPVPIPSSVLMFASGLVLLAGAARRRRGVGLRFDRRATQFA
jgi:hypothetical protein